MLPSIFLSIVITAFVGLAAPAGCHSGWWRKVTISVLSGINALITALLAFLKYPQKLDAHDQARLRFTQLDQDHRFMLHSQHFAYMPIEEVMKQFHATKVSVCVEMKFWRARAESSRLPARHRRDACSMAWYTGERHGGNARLPLRVPEKDSGGV